jgi:hypothetical protein
VSRSRSENGVKKRLSFSIRPARIRSIRSPPLAGEPYVDDAFVAAIALAADESASLEAVEAPRDRAGGHRRCRLDLARAQQVGGARSAQRCEHVQRGRVGSKLLERSLPRSCQVSADQQRSGQDGDRAAVGVGSLSLPHSLDYVGVQRERPYAPSSVGSSTCLMPADPSMTV